MMNGISESSYSAPAVREFNVLLERLSRELKSKFPRHADSIFNNIIKLKDFAVLLKSYPKEGLLETIMSLKETDALNAAQALVVLDSANLLTPENCNALLSKEDGGFWIRLAMSSRNANRCLIEADAQDRQGIFDKIVGGGQSAYAVAKQLWSEKLGVESEAGIDVIPRQGDEVYAYVELQPLSSNKNALFNKKNVAAEKTSNMIQKPHQS